MGFRHGLRFALAASVVMSSLWLACGAAYGEVIVPWYQITGFGYYGSVASINDNGQMAGSYLSLAARWGAGVTTPTYLGALNDSHVSAATGINASGQVVGQHNTVGNASHHATRWNADGTPTDLGTLGGSNSDAHAINASGEVVGTSETSEWGTSHAVRWTSDGSTAIDLGTLGGRQSQAFDINDGGQVVGYSEVPMTGQRHAVRWDSYGTPTDLGTLSTFGGYWSEALGINGSGQAVGYYTSVSGAYSSNHAARWDADGTATALNTPAGTYSEANAINDGGWVVGHYDYFSGASPNHAALWIGNNVFDLNALIRGGTGGWTLYEAFDINATGQIIGYGTDAQSQWVTFLLTPEGAGGDVPPGDGSVPEPSTLALLCSSLIVGARVLRRRRA